MNRYDHILSRLEGKTRRGDLIECLCPAHNDTNKSLTVGLGKNGRLMMHCHAGCSINDIRGALGLTWREMFPEMSVDLMQPDATYDYRNEKGELLYQVLRFSNPKTFRQRRPDGHEWVWNLNGVERVLYRLPELIAAPKDKAVFLVEGEKDVETLRAKGLVATTAGSSSSWREGYTRFFIERKLIILPDNDTPGRTLAREEMEAILPVAKSVCIVHLPVRQGGDVTDWFEAGGNLEGLRALVREAMAPLKDRLRQRMAELRRGLERLEECLLEVR